MSKKTISIMIPTYNEEENVKAIHAAVTNLFKNELQEYNYEVLFIDNKSKDNTRALIQAVCKEDKNTKAIFNVKNFGQFNSPYYGLINTTGDCVVSLCADFQDPVEVIPRLVNEWENGFKIVCAIKSSSKENPIMYFLRSLYYKLLHKVSSVEMIEHFTGFGLYDKAFIDVPRNLKDPTPFYRGLVAELGFDTKQIEYVQAKRRAGKTSNNWVTLYDAAMLSFTSYTKLGLRIPAIIGFLMSLLSMLIALGYLIAKIVFWNSFTAGFAPLIIGIFFFGSIQLFFIGVIGEYISAINERLKNRPLVIEETRINFTEKTQNSSEENYD